MLRIDLAVYDLTPLVAVLCILLPQSRGSTTKSTGTRSPALSLDVLVHKMIGKRLHLHFLWVCTCEHHYEALFGVLVSFFGIHDSSQCVRMTFHEHV